jgi:diguanylate cyclase
MVRTPMNLRSLSLEAKLLVAFAIGASGLIIALMFAAREGAAYLDADARGDNLRDLDRAVTTLYLAARTAESSQRGYLLTGRENFLTAYTLAVRDIDGQVREARALAQSDPETTAAVDRMTPRVGRLMAALAHGIDVQRRDGIEAARALVVNDPGLLEMRAIRESWQAMHDDLRGRAAANQEGVRSHYRSTMELLVVGVGLALLTLTLVYFVIATELHERRRLAERVRREADHDELTKLPNRRFFTQWLGYALAQARRENGTLGLLCIDIDGFKAVNDRMGHGAGDALLVEIARRFTGEKRDSDVLARIGGDEFVLGAAGVQDGRDLARLAQRMIDSLANPPIADVPVGASIGIAFFPDDASDPPGLLASADAAMYAAKRSGRNRVTFSARSDDA